MRFWTEFSRENAHASEALFCSRSAARCHVAPLEHWTGAPGQLIPRQRRPCCRPSHVRSDGKPAWSPTGRYSDETHVQATPMNPSTAWGFDMHARSDSSKLDTCAVPIDEQATN